MVESPRSKDGRMSATFLGNVLNHPDSNWVSAPTLGRLHATNSRLNRDLRQGVRNTLDHDGSLVPRPPPIVIDVPTFVRKEDTVTVVINDMTVTASIEKIAELIDAVRRNRK